MSRAVPLIEECEFGHRFAKFHDHPRNSLGNSRCPYCMVIGLDAARAELKHLRDALERIADDKEGGCTRLMVYPSICKRAYQAQQALK